MKAVIAENLVKTYNKGSVQALDGLSLDVEEGTVLGVLGPNGAGKTTTVRILATLLTPDSGRANVAGIDVLKHPDEVRKIIGLSGQYAAVDETLTGWDNLIMFGRLYHLSSKAAKERAVELLEQFSGIEYLHQLLLSLLIRLISPAENLHRGVSEGSPPDSLAENDRLVGVWEGLHSCYHL